MYIMYMIIIKYLLNYHYCTLQWIYCCNTYSWAVLLLATAAVGNIWLKLIKQKSSKNYLFNKKEIRKKEVTLIIQ